MYRDSFVIKTLVVSDKSVQSGSEAIPVMESVRLSSRGYANKYSSNQLPPLNFKATKTSKLRCGASLTELENSASIHKFPAPRRQACLARLKSKDDYHVEIIPSRKQLLRKRSKSYDPDDVRMSHRRLPPIGGGNYKCHNIFNGSSILWKHKIPVQVNLFWHEDFDVIEVVTFDLLHNVDLERLYVVASQIFDIIESHKEVQDMYTHTISKSEAIQNARINCTIEYLMCHLGSEKISFMPVVPTLRRYNGRHTCRCYNRMEVASTARILFILCDSNPSPPVTVYRQDTAQRASDGAEASLARDWSS